MAMMFAERIFSSVGCATWAATGCSSEKHSATAQQASASNFGRFMGRSSSSRSSPRPAHGRAKPLFVAIADLRTICGKHQARTPSQAINEKYRGNLALDFESKASDQA